MLIVFLFIPEDVLLSNNIASYRHINNIYDDYFHVEKQKSKMTVSQKKLHDG